MIRDRRQHRMLQIYHKLSVRTITLLVLAVVLSSAHQSVFSESLSGVENRGQVRAVPTFECMSLYWNVAEGSPGQECHARFRPVGHHEWSEGQSLWFDTKIKQYRGSVVHLDPDTEYEFELMTSGIPSIRVVERTWSNVFPIASTVTLPGGILDEPIRIVEGGSPEGYLLYTSAPGAPL